VKPEPENVQYTCELKLISFVPYWRNFLGRGGAKPEPVKQKLTLSFCWVFQLKYYQSRSRILIYRGKKGSKNAKI
jgi:hypothetical protein